MRKLLLASIASVLAVPALAGGITHSWPKVGNWMTVMLDGGPRGQMCSTIGKATGTDTVVDIIMAGGTTHLYVNYGKEAIALPQTVSLSTNGVQFFAAPILSASMDAMGGHFVQADLPGSSYRDVVAPALLKSNSLEVDLGGKHFVVATAHFDQVLAQVIECAQHATR